MPKLLADPNVILCKDNRVSKNVDPVLHQSIVGSLLYAAMATWLDISQAGGLISKFSAKPKEAHLTAAKWIICYHLTRHWGTRRAMEDNWSHQVFGCWFCILQETWMIDASACSHVSFMSQGPVCWSSKKQPNLTLSTTEAEYVGLSCAIQEATWIWYLPSDFHVSLSKLRWLWRTMKEPLVLQETLWHTQEQSTLTHNTITFVKLLVLTQLIWTDWRHAWWQTLWPSHFLQHDFPTCTATWLVSSTITDDYLSGVST